MSPAPPVILVDGVSKSFKLPREQIHTLKERALHPLRNPGHDTLHALRDVSFDVDQGEFFGIVGRNGSGKSTMLKCLANIYGADAGDIYVRGRLSAFIELGVGFNPDLPARDNVNINATMLGLSPKESRRRFDAIIDFAELHDFVDLKLKNYSSGMLVRLAFAVMIQVDADILLIDEVLAVGDLAFQQKCYDQFEQIRRDGKTVLLVTHAMSAVQRFCDRAVLLEHGKVVEIGSPSLISNLYQELNFSEEARAIASEGVSAIEPTVDKAPKETQLIKVEPDFGGDRYGDQKAEIIDAGFEDSRGERQETIATGEACAVVFRSVFHETVVNPHFEIDILNGRGDVMFRSDSVGATRTYRDGDEVHFRVHFENVLAPGRYFISPAVRRQPGGTWLDFRERFQSVMVTGDEEIDALLSVPKRITMTRVGADGTVDFVDTATPPVHAVQVPPAPADPPS